MGGVRAWPLLPGAKWAAPLFGSAWSRLEVKIGARCRRRSWPELPLASWPLEERWKVDGDR